MTTIKSEFGEIDLAMHHLKNQVGYRPAGSDIQSLFSMVDDLSKHKEAVSVQVDMLEKARVNTEREVTDLPNKIEADLMVEMTPIFNFFAQWSSSKANLGDLLINQITNLENMVTQIKSSLSKAAAIQQANIAQQTASKSSTTNTNSRWNLPTTKAQLNMNQVSTLHPSSNVPYGGTPNMNQVQQASIVSLQRELGLMENRLKCLEDQSTVQCVEMGGVTFRSLIDTCL
mmetsp:Transcript_17075/g.24152  ORF Transcript_17075/g.24152 Transcript_17075/m.24152 type:complete len:229 (+) Transcript_17075:1775-2461(+)